MRFVLALIAILIVVAFAYVAPDTKSDMPTTATQPQRISQAPNVIIDDATMNWHTWEFISPDTVIHLVAVEDDQAVSFRTAPRQTITAFFGSVPHGLQSEDCPMPTDQEIGDQEANAPNRLS